MYVNFLWIVFHLNSTFFHPNSNNNSTSCLQPQFKLNPNTRLSERHTILSCYNAYCQLPEIKCICSSDRKWGGFVRNDCHFHLSWLCLFSCLFDSDSSWFRPSALWPWNAPLCMSWKEKVSLPAEEELHRQQCTIN